jgi:hypothetical protein
MKTTEPEIMVACLHFAKRDGKYRLSVVDRKTHKPIKMVLNFDQLLLLVEQVMTEIINEARE